MVHSCAIELIEVAPGIEIERDIVAHMDFMPVIHSPIDMNARIFRHEPMELLAELTNRKLDERVSYDKDRNILFINLEGWSLRKASDIDDLKGVLVAACARAGKLVNVIVNQDGCRIANDLQDDFQEMINFMMKRHYQTMSRYTTSAFMRLKIQGSLSKRGQQPHILESGQEAHSALAVDEPRDDLVNWKAKDMVIARWLRRGIAADINAQAAEFSPLLVEHVPDGCQRGL